MVGALALKAIMSMGSIKGDQWNEMTKGVNGLMEIAGMGGISSFVFPVITSIKNNISLQVQGLFAPIINEITTFIGQIIGDKGLATQINQFAYQIIRLVKAFKELGAFDYLISQLYQMLEIVNLLAKSVGIFTNKLLDMYNNMVSQGMPKWLAFVSMFSPLTWAFAIADIIGNWWKSLWGG